jgi:hypothetical protein
VDGSSFSSFRLREEPLFFDVILEESFSAPGRIPRMKIFLDLQKNSYGMTVVRNCYQSTFNWQNQK